MKVYLVIYHNSVGDSTVEEIFYSEDKAEKYITDNDPDYIGYYELVERVVRN